MMPFSDGAGNLIAVVRADSPVRGRQESTGF
jgi:hypothetical protein